MADPGAQLVRLCHRHGVEDGVAQGHLEFPVTGKELDKVVKADKLNAFQAGEEVPLRKGQKERCDDGKNHQGEEDHHSGGHKEPAVPILDPLGLGHFFHRGFSFLLDRCGTKLRAPWGGEMQCDEAQSLGPLREGAVVASATTGGVC